MIKPNYEIVDMMGRRWATSLTASKAVRIAKDIEEKKGIKCQVKEIGGNFIEPQRG